MLVSMRTYFISGHLDLTVEEFRVHYTPRIATAIAEEASFVVGDARGCDLMAHPRDVSVRARGHGLVPRFVGLETSDCRETSNVVSR